MVPDRHEFAPSLYVPLARTFSTVKQLPLLKPCLLYLPTIGIQDDAADYAWTSLRTLFVHNKHYALPRGLTPGETADYVGTSGIEFPAIDRLNLAIMVESLAKLWQFVEEQVIEIVPNPFRLAHRSMSEDELLALVTAFVESSPAAVMEWIEGDNIDYVLKMREPSTPMAPNVIYAGTVWDRIAMDDFYRSLCMETFAVDRFTRAMLTAPLERDIVSGRATSLV
jgi:hypothetical protein